MYSAQNSIRANHTNDLIQHYEQSSIQTSHKNNQKQHYDFRLVFVIVSFGPFLPSSSRFVIVGEQNKLNNILKIESNI